MSGKARRRITSLGQWLLCAFARPVLLQKTRMILVISKTDRIQAARPPRQGVSRHRGLRFSALCVTRNPPWSNATTVGICRTGSTGAHLGLRDRRAKSISRRVIYFCERGQYIGTIPTMQNNIPSSNSRLGKKSAIHQGALACQSTMD